MEGNISMHGFTGLVTTFYIACWQQMGKVANPITNKIERNMDQAKYSIDMLIMLREKTKGNLTKEEENALGQAISNLQMNYLDEMKKGGSDKKAEEKDTKQEAVKNEEKK